MTDDNKKGLKANAKEAWRTGKNAFKARSNMNLANKKKQSTAYSVKQTTNNYHATRRADRDSAESKRAYENYLSSEAFKKAANNTLSSIKNTVKGTFPSVKKAISGFKPEKKEKNQTTNWFGKKNTSRTKWW